MIRPLTIITFLMACGSGLYLYQTKHDAQVLDRDIEKTVRDTATLREQSRLLAAEWTMLNDPDTLRTFSDQYLALKSISPTQFTSLADLDNKLPAVQIMTPPATPADTTDQDDETPAMTSDNASPQRVPETAQPAAPASATPAPANSAVVAAKESKPPAAASSVASLVSPAGGQSASGQSASSQAATGSQTSATVMAAKPSAERKVIALAKPLASPSSAVRAAELRYSEQRSMEQRPMEPRVAEARPAEPRQGAGSSAPATMRPTVVAAAVPTRSGSSAAYVPVAAPVSAPMQAQAPAAYSGSLLGMARTGLAPAPVPRPVPVSASQWSN
jgi:hypothetical protein